MQRLLWRIERSPSDLRKSRARGKKGGEEKGPYQDLENNGAKPVSGKEEDHADRSVHEG